MAGKSDQTLALNNEEMENAEEILSSSYLSLESCLNKINLAIQDCIKIGLEMILCVNDNPTVQEQKQKLKELKNTQEDLRVIELLRLSKISCKDENIMIIIQNQHEMALCILEKGKLFKKSCLITSALK
jgi:hypothetical protein